MQKIKNICVYCGSCAGSDPEYTAAAVRMGKALVEHDIGLVYGGAGVGTMKTVADAVLEAGGRVIGIIPEKLSGEVKHSGLTELVIVKDMHTRKRMMLDHSDAVISMPGGFGTLDEMMEAFVWRQLGISLNPCGLLNTLGFYDKLLEFLDHAVTAGFIRPQHRSIVQVSPDPAELISLLENYQHQDIRKWWG